ncbi:MAG: PAS domain S-box protein [Casimicrobiaceae bacterium]
MNPTTRGVAVRRLAARVTSGHESRYRRILEAADEGVWSIADSGLIDYVNRRGAEILARTPGEVLGRSPLTFVLAGDVAEAAVLLDRCRQGSRATGQFRIHRGDGLVRYIGLSAAPMSDAPGERPGTVATFVDMTESRQRAAEAEQTARELHELYHAAPCGYHSLDASGTVIRINDTELDWLGYRRDQVVGKMCFTDLMPPQYSRQFGRNFALLGMRDSMRDNEYELRRKDGTAFPVLLSATAVKDADGRFIGSRASVFDISKRKWAENRLSESEVRNTAILDAALDCIVSIDGDGRIIEFNPAAEATFGYTREQAVGKDASLMIIAPEMLSRPRGAIERHMARGGLSMLGKRTQATAIRSDGSRFPAEIAVTPVPLRERTIYTAYLRDITKEKWAEQELQHFAQDLRAVSRRLVEVQEAERRALANALHDLVGQKLTALSINVNIVKSGLTGDAAARLGARLDDSLKLVEETIESIRDVMAELRPAVLDDYGLTPVLRWYAEQFGRRTGIATTVVEQGPARRLPSAVEEALYRIAQEALSNVVKYAKARSATVTLGSGPQSTCLTIADDGCGFDPASVRQPARDRGWGLMIMRERAAAVGAELCVDSAPGCGTEVTVKLPGGPP